MKTHWRSLLFVPADVEHCIANAHQREADGIVLDLEDAVAVDRKPRARRDLRTAIRRLVDQNASVLVRVNFGWRDLIADLDAAVVPGVRPIMLPNVTDAAGVAIISTIIGDFEAERRIPDGAIGTVALIEHPMAIPSLLAIVAVPRLMGLALGGEDFALALGVPPRL